MVSLNSKNWACGGACQARTSWSCKFGTQIDQHPEQPLTHCNPKMSKQTASPPVNGVPCRLVSSKFPYRSKLHNLSMWGRLWSQPFLIVLRNRARSSDVLSSASQSLKQVSTTFYVENHPPLGVDQTPYTLLYNHGESKVYLCNIDTDVATKRSVYS